MKSKAQLEAADRAQRERVMRLNHYSQGRKDQETIKRLRAAMGKDKNKRVLPSSDRVRRAVADETAPTQSPTGGMVLRSLDPSMFQ